MFEPLQPGFHTLIVEGVAQAYHVAGQGQAVCIVHPGGPGAHWGYMRQPLLEEHMTMVYLVPIGTDQSGRLPEHPDGYSVARYVQQLQGLVSALGLHDIYLMGHSHGGFVAQAYGLAHPERLAGLILYSTSAVTGPAMMQAADSALRRSLARDQSPVRAATVLEAWLAVPATQDDASYTRTMRGLLPAYFAKPDQAAPQIAALGAGLAFTYVRGDSQPFDVRDSLSTLAVPVLILVGTDDFICGPAWAEILSSAIPNAVSKQIKACGHFIHLEAPAAFAQAVLAFVEQTQASSSRGD